MYYCILYIIVPKGITLKVAILRFESQHSSCSFNYRMNIIAVPTHACNCVIK